MDFLDDIISTLGGKKQDSSGDLERAQEQAKARPATPQEDAEARRQGFKNHAEYVAWLRNRQRRTGGSVKGKQQQRPSVDAAMAWHPAIIFEKLAEILSNANEKDK